MPRRISHVSSSRGFSLIELTVVLAVIVTLALILTPATAGFINDSRIARARNDCRTIATAILQFYQDTGSFPEWSAAPQGASDPQVRFDVLVSPGRAPLVSGADATPSGLRASAWGQGRAGHLADQLIRDTPGYAVRGGPLQPGWNGPYLSSALGPDPWNNQYVVNIGLIDAGASVEDGHGRVKQAVWILSAGPDGIIETPFRQPVTGAVLGGDDIGVRIQ
jgi:prepilin-type N-terminal cleavage/methylation domain-containing protein